MSTSRNAFSRVLSAVATLLALSLSLSLDGRAQTYTFEFETSEVTQPSLSVAADGQSFVFNLVGHLFRLPVTGGTARQLTFGPNYDSTPVLSPDGGRIAFVSNRDSSDGNLFILELADGSISQLTDDFQAGAPAWSPDGDTIAYISYLKREEYPADRIPGFGAGLPMGVLSTISLEGGVPQRLSTSRTLVSVFYMPDGRLAWTVAETADDAPQGGGPFQQTPISSTSIEALAVNGTVSRVGSLPGDVGPVVLNSTKDGFFYVADGNLSQYSFDSAQSNVVGGFAGSGVRMDPSPDGQVVFAASDAKLWRVNLPAGDRQQIPFLANVEMETLDRQLRDWIPPTDETVELRSVLTPRISPDGSKMVFMAAGSLWEQPLSGGDATRLIEEDSYQLEPVFSPDGQQLAFVSDSHGQREVRVFDFGTRQARTIATVPGASWALFPSWSGDGESVVFQRTDGIRDPYRFIRVNAQSAGDPVELGRSGESWTSRPHLSADGTSLYYTARVGSIANLYRLPMDQGGEAEALTDLTRHVHDAQVSPDGNWLAFRRNSEIWLAPMDSEVLQDEDFRLFSPDGGRSFSFTADSSAIVYSEGPRVWRREIQSGWATEIPLRLTLPRATAAPLLISRVRVLDLRAGQFTEETSMLIEEGRIRWIGPEAGRTIPSDVVRIDGAGRYAIPGLFDSHTHAAWSNQQITEDSLIAYGITSVRDTGSRLDIMNVLRDRGETTNLPIPRYFASGDIFEGLMPLWGDAFLEITTREEARDYVRRWTDMGASFIKVYDSLPWYLKDAVVAEATRLGMPVVGHGLSAEQIVRSVNFGFTSIEHNGGSNTNDDIVKLLAQAGMTLDPTVTVFGQGTPTMLADPTTLDEKFRTFIPEDAIAAARPGRDVSEAQLSDWIEDTLRPIRTKHDTGVRLLAGTDSLMTGVFHGPSAHWSLQFFSWGGVPAIDVLRMGTIRAAELVGASADLGSLEPGKIGDVVLLDADPLEDVANTMRIWRVVKDGHVFDPATIRN